MIDASPRLNVLPASVRLERMLSPNWRQCFQVVRRRQRATFPLIAYLVASATIPLVLDGTCRSDELVATPSAVDLRDAFARQQLLVDLDGRDVTGQASYRSLQPEIATVDAAGYVAPVADGRTEIVVASGDKETRVQVRVDGIAAGRSVDFARDVAPILSRSACNSGGCHGKASGQNGFRLSLFGFDAILTVSD